MSRGAARLLAATAALSLVLVSCDGDEPEATDAGGGVDAGPARDAGETQTDAGTDGGPTTSDAGVDAGGSAIPAPTRIWDDDFAAAPATRVYNLQGNEPTYADEGPGGSPALRCDLPISGVPYGNPRSEASLVLGGTDFEDLLHEWDQNYGWRQEFKLLSNGNPDGYRVTIWQTHTPGGVGLPPGISPLLGLQTTTRLGFYRNGIEPLPRLQGDIARTDVFDRWCILVVDYRYNHGDTGSDAWRPGFVRMYMRCGTEDALPSEPTAADLVHSYDGPIGFRADGSVGPGYNKMGIYTVELRGSVTSDFTETGRTMILNRVTLQDQVFLSADQVGR